MKTALVATIALIWITVLVVAMGPDINSGQVVGKKYVEAHQERDYSRGMVLANAMGMPAMSLALAPVVEVPARWVVVIEDGSGDRDEVEVTVEQFNRIRVGDHWERELEREE